MKRVFLIVLDSCGAGALPDAADFGDSGANTLKSCFNTGRLNIPNMLSLGLGNIEGLDFLGKTDFPKAAFGRMAEKSKGKDTTIGHWELAGIVSKKPMPTYPEGFPKEVLDVFTQKTGRGVLCNKPYSGTEVIKDYGEKHLKTGDLIVYTSADSVFQIAAHKDIVPIEKLYEYCRIAREILVGEHSVGRVIARPFEGEKGNFKRTANRKDFSLTPPKKTMLDFIKNAGKSVLAVGKTSDIFVSQGITEALISHSNNEGMSITGELAKTCFEGLCFTNLVDFDMVYGHRNDAFGYANALNEFDLWLGEFLKELKSEDMLIITADHGCDPSDSSTDHTREYVPLLIYSAGMKPHNLGTKNSFTFVAQTVCENLGVDFEIEEN